MQNLDSPFGKVLILFVRSRHCGELNRGSQNLEKFQKDLILFVRDSCLGVDSRFAEPRFSRQGIRLVTFCVVQKVTKKHAGLRPATSIQSSVGKSFRDTSDGTCRTRFFAQNGGEKALNRCERVTVLLTQDCEVSKKGCCTSSSQWVFVDEICGCTLVWV